ncbi:hypothetical protein MHM98_14005 [Psychrobium sp. MM17-31]|uniref:hypothetical protein n=1 Tax=Psychrobium sp. MM17-31 TaxID=2917758 RepID=UPI001EF48970|nr:hypothetical protein [Psychrobium sp. MM17-31]MCG7532448.1 hypothetical protein [Psychrobium sp. MM17-31]
MNFSILNLNRQYQVAQQEQLRATEQLSSQPQVAEPQLRVADDKVTLSQQVQGGHKHNSVEANTYDQLAPQARGISKVSQSSDKPTSQETLFKDAMASIIEGRLGVDKEKIKEIEAMMEEVAKDETLSSEEKERRIGELQELLDKEYEKAAEKQAHQPV